MSALIQCAFPITRTLYLHHIANLSDRICTCNHMNPNHACYYCTTPRNLMGREGIEPSVFLMLRIYSPLPSPLGIPTHILLYKTGKSWNRTKLTGFSVQRRTTMFANFPYRTHNKYTFSKNVLVKICCVCPN